MALSLRQRDQSERNFMNEIQKMQEDINVNIIYYLLPSLIAVVHESISCQFSQISIIPIIKIYKYIFLKKLTCHSNKLIQPIHKNSESVNIETVLQFLKEFYMFRDY